MPNVLIIFHSQEFGNTKRMADAVRRGIMSVTHTPTRLINTNERRVKQKDYVNADAIALGCPDYFGQPPGNLKQLFDDIYIWDKDDALPKNRLHGKPYAIFVSHGGGARVVPAIERYATAIGKKVGPTVASNGPPAPRVAQACEELGKLLGNVASGTPLPPKARRTGPPHGPRRPMRPPRGRDHRRRRPR